MALLGKKHNYLNITIKKIKPIKQKYRMKDRIDDLASKSSRRSTILKSYEIFNKKVASLL